MIGNNKKSEKFPLVQRVERLKEVCAGKKVLHLGCTEFPFTESAIRYKTHVHLELGAIAKELYGFDADAQGLDLLAKYGFNNLFAADLERLEDVPLNETFDVIVAGEIIEHLSNPGLFLRGVQRFMNQQTNLIVTTVNAYCGFRLLIYGFRSRGGAIEPTHPDHVAYYSYSTLRHALERENLRLNRFAFYDVGTNHRQAMRWTQRVANDICVKITPTWADGIVAECTLNV